MITVATQTGSDSWTIILATLSLVGGLFASLKSSFSGFVSFMMRYEVASHVTKDLFLAKRRPDNYNPLQLKKHVSLRHENEYETLQEHIKVGNVTQEDIDSILQLQMNDR